MHALQELGCSVASFDTTQYLRSTSRIRDLFAHHLNWGSPITELNRDLLEFVADEARSVTHVWIDKGKWIAPETLLQLRALTGAVFIHYTLDPQLVFNRSRHFHRSIPLYDVLFTTKPFEFDLYKEAGARKVFLVDQAYDSKRFFPRKLASEEQYMYESDVCFIGHEEHHYSERLRVVMKTGGNIKVWGPGWKKYAEANPWARKCVAGDALWGESYPIALNAAKIALGLLTKRYGETTTTRTFEIPACETFMLAERTEDHLKLFEEGKEAEFFESDDELVDKVRYYLAHATERERIARAGHERCLKAGYSNMQRMQQVLDLVDSVLSSGPSIICGAIR